MLQKIQENGCHSWLGQIVVYGPIHGKDLSHIEMFDIVSKMSMKLYACSSNLKIIVIWNVKSVCNFLIAITQPE